MDKFNLSQKLLFFSDIDDTLMQTARKTDFTKQTILWGVNKKEEPLSYIYKSTKIWLDAMIQSVEISFIPTTARNFESYKRTHFYRDKYYTSKIDMIILNFGAEIIYNNTLNKQWQEIMQNSYNSLKLNIDNLYQNANSLIEDNYSEGHGIVVKIIDSYYISIYNKKDRDNTSKNIKLEELLKEFISDEYYLYINDSSFAILPKFLNKKFAVEFVIKKYNPISSIGAGDNTTDLDFMKLSDFYIVPKDSQLERLKN
jgi:hydroxymethylpyrimidine pyrophosphatase-like HAD family hydrolase